MSRQHNSKTNDFATRIDNYLPKSFGRMVLIVYMYTLTAIAMVSFVLLSVGCFTFAVLGAPSGSLISISWTLLSCGILVIGIIVSFLIANAASGLRLGRQWALKTTFFFCIIMLVGAIVIDIVVHVSVHRFHTLFDVPVVIAFVCFGLLFLPSTRKTISESQMAAPQLRPRNQRSRR